MNTSIKHLPLPLRQQLDAVTQIIASAIQPEKIILFGVHASPDAAALYAGVLPNFQPPFDLLVITGQQERRSDYELQDMLENRCREIAAVTAIIHDITHVNRQISRRQYFFSMVCLEGIQLYDAGTVALRAAGQPDLEAVRITAQKDFERWGGQANAFFKSAGFNLLQKEWKIALFLLHQAAEQIYQAILLVFTGYKPTTHNLDKLRRYTNRFSIGLAALFPRDHPHEEQLFRLLLSGYVDARYKDDYTVAEADVRTLAERVGQLLDIAGRVCKNHLLSLEKRAVAG